MTGKLFVGVLIALQLCASASYLAHGDWWRTLYWLAASILNIVVTW